MKLLLDTHIWLWALESPDKLGKKVTRILEDADTELWLSPISLWEVLLLVERGRISLTGGKDPRQWIEQALDRGPMKQAPVTYDVAVSSRAVRVEHDDPADRFLAATAAVYDLALVTADDRLLRGKGFRTLANR
ncbi:MAG TPA: type II toxin-antitoxin system VapC family toxin [Polyangiaceae bacterium]